MTEFIVTSPDGQQFQISAPEGSTPQQALTFAKQQFAQMRRAQTKRENPAEYDPQSPEFRAQYGATSGMSGIEKFRAGYGKGVVDLARGAGQAIGAVSRQDVVDSRARDTELMSSGAGKAGSMVGTAATLAPVAYIPGANTVAGSAAIGGTLGFLQPSVSTRETLVNTGLGAVLSPAALMATRGVASLWQAGKSLVEPFTKGGQQRIAARTMQAFAGGEKAAQAAAQNIDDALAAGVLPGVSPTTAELANNAGLAQLERTVKNNPEFMQAFTDRAAANRNAIMSSLDDIAGDPARMQAASAARDAIAKPLYQQADDAVVPATKGMLNLFKRPSMSKAFSRAQALAAEAGEEFPSNVEALTGRQLHYLKMAMDDLSDNPHALGIAANEARAIRSTRDALVSEIEQVIPEYGMAREAYAAGSKPINQMQIGQSLRDKLTPALADFGAGTRIRPQAYARALREGDALAANVLGRNQASIEQVMTPTQMTTLRQVGEQLARRTNAEELGRAVGSPTAQNMISQNVVRQFMGPLGLPESTITRAAESTLLQSILRPAQFAGKLGEQRAMEQLAKASLEPTVAKELLRVGLSQKQILLLRAQGLIALEAGNQASRAYASKQ